MKPGMLQCMGSQIDATEQLNKNNNARRSSRIISNLSKETEVGEQLPKCKRGGLVWKTN